MWEEGWLPPLHMDNILCWNVRGANQAEKMKAIKHFIAQQKIGLASLLETKVKASNLGTLYSMVFKGWCFTSNLQKHYNGRIVIAWNPNLFIVSILHTSAQCIHCVIKPRSGLPEFFCTFIYAFNKAGNREQLWQDLTDFAASQDGPWLIMGDLNCVLQMEERCGSNVKIQEILPGRMCMERCGLIDIQYGGQFFTWSNKQGGEDRVFSKIDRVMANEAWLETFSRFNATFLPEGISDHCPALVRSINDDSEGKKPFKYYRMWREAEGYKEKVRMAWEGNDQGTSMYRITRKLKRVKTCLKELNKLGFCSIQADAQQAYQQLILAQQHLHASPNDAGLAELEKQALQNYKVKQRIYDQFLQQKAKFQWIREGDSNTAVFHRSIKQRRLQNTIYAIRDCKGVLQDDPSSVAGAFLEYYKDLLGVREIGRQKVQQEIVDLGPVV
ncbi:LINE-1 retrotransposable element ORF2 protein [Bienertia sinuspersici]